MPNNSYWIKRYDRLQERMLQKADDLVEETEKAYDKAIKEMERDIMSWHQRFANNNDISLQEAKKLLTTDELEEFKWTVDDYIEYGMDNSLSKEWMKQLENASTKVHVSRLESMKMQLRHKVEKLHSIREQGLNTLLPDIYTEKYYRSIYEIQQGYNIGRAFTQFNDKMIDQILTKPWAPDGIDFSKRIWRDRDVLVDTLDTELKHAIIRGEPPDRMIKLLSKKFKTSKFNAGRLVMTESAFFSSAAQKKSFREMDVDRYEYVATLDQDTSDLCRNMDSNVFRLAEYEVGVTAPPLHQFCRSTTVPYFPDNYTERFARNTDGSTYHVKDMPYKKWHEKYVN